MVRRMRNHTSIAFALVFVLAAVWSGCSSDPGPSTSEDHISAGVPEAGSTTDPTPAAPAADAGVDAAPAAPSAEDACAAESAAYCSVLQAKAPEMLARWFLDAVGCTKFRTGACQLRLAPTSGWTPDAWRRVRTCGLRRRAISCSRTFRRKRAGPPRARRATARPACSTSNARTTRVCGLRIRPVAPAGRRCPPVEAARAARTAITAFPARMANARPPNPISCRTGSRARNTRTAGSSRTAKARGFTTRSRSPGASRARVRVSSGRPSGRGARAASSVGRKRPGELA